MGHVQPRRPAGHVHVLHPPAADPGITEDERSTIIETMVKTTYAVILMATSVLVPRQATFAL